MAIRGFGTEYLPRSPPPSLFPSPLPEQHHSNPISIFNWRMYMHPLKMDMGLLGKGERGGSGEGKRGGVGK